MFVIAAIAASAVGIAWAFGRQAVPVRERQAPSGAPASPVAASVGGPSRALVRNEARAREAGAGAAIQAAGAALKLGGALAGAAKAVVAAAGGGAAGAAAATAATSVALAFNVGPILILAPVVVVFAATMAARAMVAPKLFRRRLNPVTTLWLHDAEKQAADLLLALPGAPVVAWEDVADDRTRDSVVVDGAFIQRGGRRWVMRLVSGDASSVAAVAERARALAMIQGGLRVQFGTRASGFGAAAGEVRTAQSEDLLPDEWQDWFGLPCLDGVVRSVAAQQAAASGVEGATRGYLRTAALLDVVGAHVEDPRLMIDGLEYAWRLYSALLGVPFRWPTVYERNHPSEAWFDLGGGVWALAETLRLPYRDERWNAGVLPSVADGGPAPEQGVLAINVVAARHRLPSTSWEV